MTIAELKRLLEVYGIEHQIPVSFNAFEGRPDSDTMLMWANPYDSDFYADGTNYKRIGHIEVSLIQATRDLDVEMDFESMLIENRLTFALTGSEHYDEEDLWETIYEIEVFK